MLQRADSAPGIVSADPSALEAFAAGGGTRTAGVEAAKGTVDTAVAAWNHSDTEPRFRVPLPQVGAGIESLIGAWSSVDNGVSRVAAAFRQADQVTGAGVATATQFAVNGAMTDKVDFNPLEHVTGPDQAAWNRAVNPKNYANGGSYAGATFIRAPDGRMYPLVIPHMRGQDGTVYSADDGGHGDIGTLDGADPGWHVVKTYSGDGNLLNTNPHLAKIAGYILGGLGGSMPGRSANSGPEDYAGLAIRGNGRPVWFGKGKDFFHDDKGASGLREPYAGVTSDDPGRAKAVPPSNSKLPLGRYTGVYGAASIVTNAVNSGKDASDEAKARGQAAYKLTTERNIDGRVRARLTFYKLGTDKDDGSQLIVPIAAGTDAHGQLGGEIVRYRPHGPGPTGQPDSSDDYHIVKGVKEKFWSSNSNPSYSYTHQDK